MPADTYMTGKPCKRGLVAPRLSSSKACTCSRCKNAKNGQDRKRRAMQTPEFIARRNRLVKARRTREPRRVMIDSAKWRAKRAGVPFDLTMSDIVVPEFCPALGMRLTWSDRVADATPSLDRKIPALGYVRGNVSVISHKANRIKSNATVLELQHVAQWLQLQFTS